MTENSELIAVDQGEDVKLLSPTDSKHWELVQLVMAQFGPDCTTTIDALRKANVPVNTYYRAMRNPVVQQLRLQQMVGVSAATQHLIEKNWLGVLANMSRIARSGDSRESVQAARLLRDVYKDVREGISPVGGTPGEESDAARAVRRFLSGKSIKRVRRTTVTEEVEVEDGLSGGNYEIIEGSASSVPGDHS